MFGSYKKGMADAMAAYEDFGKKQEAAIGYVSEVAENTADKVDSLGAQIGEMADYITDQEKAELYRLNTPLDIADLDAAEKRLLLAVLYQLAEDAEKVTDEQKNYLRAVQKYLGIKNPQIRIDLEAVENIEDVSAQKAVLQTVLEFFYLGTTPKAYTEEQLEFLDFFNVNRKSRKEIMGYIEAIVARTGKAGLAEKYGFASEIEETNGRSNREPEAIKLIQLPVKDIKAKLECADGTARYHVYASDEDDENNANPQDLWVGYDAPRYQGRDSVYFHCEGISVKTNGAKVGIPYSTIVRLKNSEDGLEIVTKDPRITATIHQSPNISSEMIALIRCVLAECCADMPEFTNNVDEEKASVIEHIISSNIGKISKASYNHIFLKNELDKADVKQKLKFAIKMYAEKVSAADAIAFVDTTLFSDGGAGVLFARDGIAFSQPFFGSEYIPYENIEGMYTKGSDLIFVGTFSQNGKNRSEIKMITSEFDTNVLKNCLEQILFFL